MDFEFHVKGIELESEQRAEVEARLRELAADHKDITGASVAVEELTGATTPYNYQARVVVYMRPNDIAAVEKQETAMGAVRGALDAVERHVREYRAKLREPWKSSSVGSCGL
jgi:ribosome-associated translation inhibitor RaiA